MYTKVRRKECARSKSSIIKSCSRHFPNLFVLVRLDVIQVCLLDCTHCCFFTLGLVILYLDSDDLHVHGRLIQGWLLRKNGTLCSYLIGLLGVRSGRLRSYAQHCGSWLSVACADIFRSSRQSVGRLHISVHGCHSGSYSLCPCSKGEETTPTKSMGEATYGRHHRR